MIQGWLLCARLLLMVAVPATLFLWSPASVVICDDAVDDHNDYGPW